MATNFKDVRSEIEDNIKPNGVGAITGQVMQDAMMSLVDASEAEISALNQEVDGKLAQLSQEWQEIKDANFQPTFEVLPHITKVIVTDGAAILEPDKFYDFGEAAQIAVAFAPASEPQYAAQYAFQFKCPADAPTTLSMPDNIAFPIESDSSLNLKAGRTYQITIVDGLAVATSWEV